MVSDTRMQLWGLTGGIASGKSTVHGMLARLGAQIVDADAVYHGLLRPEAGAPSPLARTLAAAFQSVLLPDGQIDRRALGTLVFENPAARARLEALTHPAVAEAVTAHLQTLADGGCRHAVYDVPLLYERDMQARFAGIMLVWVPPAIQLARLMARNGLDAASAAARIAAQLPLDSKRQRARWVIDNSADRDTTQRQVAAIWQAIQSG
jgi:dephospho-CoA kinase